LSRIPVKAFQPHPAQDEILASRARFKVLACGRRFGKGNGVLRTIATDAANNPDSEFWIISPDFTFTNAMWKKAISALGKVKVPTAKGAVRFMKDPHVRDKELPLFNGSLIAFKSAHDPIKVGRGAGDNLLGVAFDEAAYCDVEAWKSVQPALLDNGAWAYFLSTPNALQPKNWFYDQFILGQDKAHATCESCFGNGCDACGGLGYQLIDNPDKDPEYQSWQFSSYDNPYIDNTEIEQMIKRFGWSEVDIRREVYGEFVGGDAVVFNHDDIIACSIGQEEAFDQQYQYVTGVDLGRVGSYTVIVTIKIQNDDSELPRVVKIERFQGSWDLQKARILEHLRSYGHPPCFIDATGLGDSMDSELRNLGGRHIFPQKLTTQLKVQMVNALIAAVEGRNVLWYPHKQLEKEMLDFEAVVTPGGTLQYRRPKGSGMFDDSVMALAFSWWGYLRVGAPQRSSVWAVGIG